MTIDGRFAAIAYYLPQFYPVALNDKWWGEGYTEWNAVLAAQRGWRSEASSRLSPGELGFYDLRDKETRRKQGELAQWAGLEAFAIYHYYSKGNRVLPEVVDRILADGEPDFPFMFCWANHDWTLAWQNRPDVTIWKQEYDEHESDDHINHLMQTFDQPRYYKIDGAPVLSIYNPQAIPQVSAVLEHWRQVAKDNGHNTLIVLGVTTDTTPASAESLGLDSWVLNPAGVIRAMPPMRRAVSALRSPLALFRFLKFRDYTYDSERLHQRAFRAASSGQRAIPTVMSNWNNSGRRPSGAWTLMSSPRKFELSLRLALRCAPVLGKGEHSRRLVFINAWNEWGESMAVEPSAENGREYLTAIRSVVGKPIARDSVSTEHQGPVDHTRQ